MKIEHRTWRVIEPPAKGWLWRLIRVLVLAVVSVTCGAIAPTPAIGAGLALFWTATLVIVYYAVRWVWKGWQP